MKFNPQAHPATGSLARAKALVHQVKLRALTAGVAGIFGKSKPVPAEAALAMAEGREKAQAAAMREFGITPVQRDNPTRKAG